MYTTPEDFIMETDEIIDDLIFRDDKKNVKLPKAGAGLLKTFKQFVANQSYREFLLDPVIGSPSLEMSSINFEFQMPTMPHPFQ